jgi:hypothetical protein
MHSFSVGAGGVATNSAEQNLNEEYGGVDISGDANPVIVTGDASKEPYLTEVEVQIGYSTNSLTDPHGVLGSALITVFKPPWL